MRAQQFINETSLGTSPKRPARSGSRPERGHETTPRYVTDRKTGKQYDPEEQFNKLKNSDEFKGIMNRLATKESFDEAQDPELNQLKKFAVAHYPNVNPEVAFQKFIQRSLMHAKQDDQRQDARIDRLEATLNSLVAKQHVAESWEEIDEWLIQERGKASRSLCQSSVPDEDLGASQLASCKSQGLRARDGEKSHLVGHGGSKVRIKVGGKKIKGKKYGGPLPDYGTRKGQ